MSCCAPGAETSWEANGPSGEELLLASSDLGNGLRQTDLAVPAVHCGACIRTVETTLRGLPGVTQARLNLSTRRVSVQWRGDLPPPMVRALQDAGYPPHLFETTQAGPDPQLSRLIRALAVAGFAAMNIMLLSVSVWSGADPETRQAFHWISAALALPTLIYSGGVFYASAWQVLRRGRTNMDVPISIGITLAYTLSFYDTLHGGEHAYFDASVTLVFFLLIGRALDHLMRERARTAVRGLVRMTPRGATVLHIDGAREFVPLADIEPGMTLLVMAGDRIPVDAEIVAGRSDLDCSIATGESRPVAVGPGTMARAGALNLAGPLTLRAIARANNSFLAEMVRLMEVAEGGRARYRRLADRAAQLYSPMVHATAFLTFLGWMTATGDWHRAISIAIAVLIITCPCALGLAVPIVQVVAARRLFEKGVMIKDGSALERLAEIDCTVFDKTGTLTAGAPALASAEGAPRNLAIAAALAAWSRHPVARAIATGVRYTTIEPTSGGITEHPGLGIEAKIGDDIYRLGRAEWALDGAGSGTVLSCNGKFAARFEMAEALRTGSAAAIAELNDIPIEMLTGDGADRANPIAAQLGGIAFTANMLPGDKLRHIEALIASGRKPLMVGDGLNDAPALAAAHVSIAPATAADIGRNAADFVFLHDSLEAVPFARRVARQARKLVFQNFAIAVVYNALALPIAIAGYVTPLVAALAMSLSSIVVVVNALRLRTDRPASANAPYMPKSTASTRLVPAE